jgi:hypothetical protein
MRSPPMYVALIFALVIYGVPLVAAVFVWSSFIEPANTAAPRIRVVALSLATLSVLWGFATLALVYFVRPMPRFDYSIEMIGLALSVPAVAASICDIRRPRVRASNTILAISCWMLFLWFLQACTY